VIPGRAIARRALAGRLEGCGELGAPRILDVERERVGQVLLEQLGRQLGRMQGLEAILLGHGQVELEALDLVHDAPALESRRAQQAVEHRAHEGEQDQQHARRQRHRRAEHVEAERLAGEKGHGEEAREHRPGPGPVVPEADYLAGQEIAADRPAGQPDRHEQRGDQVGREGDGAEQGEACQRQARDQPARIAQEIDLLEAERELAFERGDRVLDALMVDVLELERAAGGEQLLEGGALVGRQRLGAAAAARQAVAAALVLDGQPALDRHVDHGRGEGLLVEVHAHQVAHGGGREALGRMEQREDGAARRIAADAPPGHEVIGEGEDQPDRGDDDRGIIAQHSDPLRPRRRRFDHALLPGKRDGQALIGPEPPGGSELRVADSAAADRVVAALLALRAGIGHLIEGAGAGRQLDRRPNALDREDPAIAGDVPVELVVVLEEAELSGGDV